MVVLSEDCMKSGTEIIISVDSLSCRDTPDEESSPELLAVYNSGDITPLSLWCCGPPATGIA